MSIDDGGERLIEYGRWKTVKKQIHNQYEAVCHKKEKTRQKSDKYPSAVSFTASFPVYQAWIQRMDRYVNNCRMVVSYAQE